MSISFILVPGLLTVGVNVCDRETGKTYNVMKFSKALNVDVKSWTKASNIRLEREGRDSAASAAAIKLLAGDGAEASGVPRFGAGSEFGQSVQSSYFDSILSLSSRCNIENNRSGGTGRGSSQKVSCMQ